MTPARRLSRSVTMWLVAATILLFWFVHDLWPYQQMVEWVRSCQIIIALILTAVCARSIYEILATRMPHEALQLVLGIAIMCAGIAGNAAWMLLWRMAGKPPWMLDAPINAFWLWVMVVGMFMPLIAPRSVEGEFPRENWVRVSVVIVLSTALAIYVLASPPDASGIAEWLRPYLA